MASLQVLELMSVLPSSEDIKLIVCDVDGTLLTSQHTIHPKTLSAFQKLREAHPALPIVIASGKQYNSCAWIREALGLPLHFPSAHCNGTLIYGGGNAGGLLFQNGLSPEAVKHIVDGTRSFGTFVFTEDAALLVTNGEGVHRKNWCEIAGKYDVNVLDCTQDHQFAETMGQIAAGELVVAKVTVCVDPSGLDDSKRSLEALTLTSSSPFTITSSLPFIFEAIPADTNKGTALVQICESLGSTPAQALVFGDGDNDVGMLERAGHAVAMKNAMPKAIAAAKYITVSNDEGGVGTFIDQVWNL